MTGAVAAMAGVSSGVTISAGSGGTYEDLAISPSNASVTLQFNASGDILVTRANGADPDIGDWMSPKGGEPAADYELRVTPTSGTFTSGTTGSWLPLNISRSYNVGFTADTNGAKSCTATYEIRRVADSVVLSSVSYTLIATVEL